MPTGKREMSLEHQIRNWSERFDASVGADEERAATDLAESFSQGLSWEVAVTSLGTVHVQLDDAEHPVVHVGPDHVGCGMPLNLLVKRDLAVLTLGATGPKPVVTRDSFLRCARPWARAKALVEVRGAGSWRGWLTQVGTDYLALESSAGRKLIPMACVGSIRLVLGG